MQCGPAAGAMSGVHKAAERAGASLAPLVGLALPQPPEKIGCAQSAAQALPHPCRPKGSRMNGALLSQDGLQIYASD